MNLNTCYTSLLYLGVASILPISADTTDIPGTVPARVAAPTVPEAPRTVVLPVDWNAENSNVSRELKLTLTPDTRTLTFTQLALRDFSPITSVEVKTGQGYAAGVSHSGITLTPTAPALWNFVVDVSGTSPQRIKAIEAELNTVLSIIKSVPEGDRIALYALASDIDKWGAAANEGEREALKSMLREKMRKKTYGDGRSFRRSSLLYIGLRKLIAETSDSPCKRMIVLLSDGNDETGGKAPAAGEREAELNQLTTEAKAAGVPIHTLGFAQNSNDRGGFSHLYSISVATKGKHHAAALGTFRFPKGVNVAQELLYQTHPNTGSLTVQLPQQMENIRVFLKGDEGTNGFVTVTQESLHAATQKDTEELPPAPIAETSEEGVALNSLLDTLATLETKLVELQARETAAPEPKADELKALTDAITPLLSEATNKANALKAKDQSKLAGAADALQKADGTPETRHKRAQQVLKLFKDHPSAIDEQEILLMLGRKAPLPVMKEKTYGPGEIGGGIALGILLLIFLTLCCRRKKKKGTNAPVPVRNGIIEITPGMDESGIHTEHPLLCKICCVHENLSWRIYKPTAIVGRNAGNDIIISNTSVSASHCVLKLNRNGRWFLTDLGSANGIYHNRTTVRELELQDGTEFELGEVLLRFHDCRRK